MFEFRPSPIHDIAGIRTAGALEFFRELVLDLIRVVLNCKVNNCARDDQRGPNPASFKADMG